MWSVSGSSGGGTSEGASYRVCWPVTSVLLRSIKHAQLLSLSCSEDLFPVGGSFAFVISVWLYKEISNHLHLVQELNQSGFTSLTSDGNPTLATV